MNRPPMSARSPAPSRGAVAAAGVGAPRAVASPNVPTTTVARSLSAPEATALKLLDNVQLQLTQAESTLLQGDATTMERACSQVAQALLVVAQQRPGTAELTTPVVQAKLRALSTQFAALREGMARRQSMAERELRTLIPETKPQVYGGQRAGGYAPAKASFASVRA